MNRLNVLIVVLACSLASSAQVLKGMVQNGTTNKPAAGEEVTLNQPGQNGMQEVGKAKTNARGEFQFKLPDPAAGYVILVNHQKAPYSYIVKPGAAAAPAQVQVYDVADQLDNIERTEHALIIQADQGVAQVNEIVTVTNNSKPPRSLPSLEVYLPEGAEIADGSAFQKGLMPMRKAPVPLANNKYAFLYPVRPGETQFEVTYTLQYVGKLKFEPKLAAPVSKFAVVMPKAIHFSAGANTPFQHAGGWDRFPAVKNIDVQQAKNVQPGTPLTFEIQGAGVINEASQQPENRDTRPGGGLGAPNENPTPLNSGQQWAFVGVLTLFLTGGGVLIFFVHRNPGDGPVGSAALLEALKEEMFQLESERAQGRVSQQEYNAAKSALDKTLQRVVRRKKTAAKAS